MSNEVQPIEEKEKDKEEEGEKRRMDPELRVMGQVLRILDRMRHGPPFAPGTVALQSAVTNYCQGVFPWG